ncbi:MAG: hypothetical protein RBR18_04920 [Desulfovibrionaceae bacterium]|jgi:hypothetical protein|nr:hypothetical protein [Desulfovibrionaceae bacterium]
MNTKHFLTGFLCTLLVAGLFPFTNYVLTHLSGEQTLYCQIIARLQKNADSLYDPLIISDYNSYKVRLCEELRPRIAVVGSSRALELRASFFQQSFANCGLGIRRATDLAWFADAVAQDSLPNMVLLSVDFWWFTPDPRKQVVEEKRTLSDGTQRNLDMFLMPLVYAAQGKLRLNNVLALSPFLRGEAEPVRIGMRAQEKDEGFQADGSYLYKKTYKSMTSEEVARHVNSEFVGTGVFTYDNGFHSRPIDDFFRDVDALRAKGVTVITYLPPVAPSLYDAFSKDPRYAYIFQTLSYIRERYPILDYTDPYHLGAADGDFIDATHPSPRVNAALLLDMLHREPALTPYISKEGLAACMERES